MGSLRLFFFWLSNKWGIKKPWVLLWSGCPETMVWLIYLGSLVVYDPEIKLLLWNWKQASEALPPCMAYIIFTFVCVLFVFLYFTLSPPSTPYMRIPCRVSWVLLIFWPCNCCSCCRQQNHWNDSPLNIFRDCQSLFQGRHEDQGGDLELLQPVSLVNQTSLKWPRNYWTRKIINNWYQGQKSNGIIKRFSTSLSVGGTRL